MICPKCESSNVSLRMLEGPSETRYKKKKLGLLGLLLAVCTLGISLLFRGKAKVKTTVFKKIAFCQNCGYSWTVRVGHDEKKRRSRRKKRNSKLWFIVLGIFVAICLVGVLAQSDEGTVPIANTGNMASVAQTPSATAVPTQTPTSTASSIATPTTGSTAISITISPAYNHTNWPLPTPNESGLIIYEGNVGEQHDENGDVILSSLFDFSVQRLKIGYEDATLSVDESEKEITIFVTVPDTYTGNEKLIQIAGQGAAETVGGAVAEYGHYREYEANYFGGLFDEWNASIYVSNVSGDMLGVGVLKKGTHNIVW